MSSSSLPVSARRPLGSTDIQVPPIIFGTSALGNLYHALDYAKKLDIARAWFDAVESPVALDSAGKYGAGLALETIGNTLRDLGKQPDDVIISNKLGWRRVPLTTEEPQFEPGVWKDIAHDAELVIGYDGIFRCFEQGNSLLGSPFTADLVSVHDPDEYVSVDRAARMGDVVDAYRALSEIRDAGRAKAIGIGAKDWTVIRDLTDTVDLDWVMVACSLTVYRHDRELVSFMESLSARGIGIINSAVFNAGFLIGGPYFDYELVTPTERPELFEFRRRFLDLCHDYSVDPAAACIEFGLSGPGVCAVALNTSKASRVCQNAQAVTAEAPTEFWVALKQAGLIRHEYPYV